jgi:iron-sulfur cluster repair protein YtfE (RIC family)
METTLQLLDQLIDEHKVIKEKGRSLVKAVNDFSLLSNIKQAKNVIIEGKYGNKVDIKLLDGILEEIDIRLGKHFAREETILLPIVKKFHDDKLVNSFNARLFEHTDLKDRLLHAHKRTDELKDGADLSAAVWDARVSDLRVHISHTFKLLETHAAMENHFFSEVRRYLKKNNL